MSELPPPDAQWLQALADGQEQAVAEFWDQYGDRLHRLAERHLAPKLSRRVGPDDVVQSVCRTFFRRAREGQFELADSEALWRLLCVITLTKCRLTARFHGRERRGLAREQSLDRSSGESFAGPEAADGEPTPDLVAQWDDELTQLLAGLDPEERQVVDLKLQEHTNDEIARLLDCSERTVRRIMKRVQTRLREMLSDSSRELN